jgi:hypothetical protein
VIENEESKEVLLETLVKLWVSLEADKAALKKILNGTDGQSETEVAQAT